MEKLIIAEENVNPRDRVVLLNLKGTIETTNAGSLEDVIQRIIGENCYRIVVDLSGVTYISSAGWGIFVSEIKQVRRQSGDIKLAAMRPEVREVFDLLEFNNILKPYPDKQEAVKAFQSAGTRSEQG
ncbi:MAG: STAS domain-containing protein [Candidatus Krumholzibacteria bacterium]|nr:STAS domain-containing protein [Candidatus Krumholzibacteria bacterium]